MILYLLNIFKKIFTKPRKHLNHNCQSKFKLKTNSVILAIMIWFFSKKPTIAFDVEFNKGNLLDSNKVPKEKVYSPYQTDIPNKIKDIKSNSNFERSLEEWEWLWKIQNPDIPFPYKDIDIDSNKPKMVNTKYLKQVQKKRKLKQKLSKSNQKYFTKEKIHKSQVKQVKKLSDLSDEIRQENRQKQKQNEDQLVERLKNEVLNEVLTEINENSLPDLKDNLSKEIKKNIQNWFNYQI